MSGNLVQDPQAFVTQRGERSALDIQVSGASCGGCMAKIETAVGALPGVEIARLNLSTGRMHVEWAGSLGSRRVIEVISSLGYGAAAVDPGRTDTSAQKTERRLFGSMAVAGVAMAIIMFLSEPMWFGSDMSAETRTLLRWASAIIAIPAAAFSGWPFFSSALSALRHRQVNMDVPISLAVILALILSLVETITAGPHSYFDASVMLLFFLLIGRFLDARLRGKAYEAANALAALQAATATRLAADGSAIAVKASDVRTGDILLIAAGDRLPVDAEIATGVSDADLRMVTGEVEPVAVGPGRVLPAGTVNLSAALHVRALAPASRSLTADIARMLEAGEQKKSAYRRIADKAAAVYVPQVHAMAALGFIGWLLAGASLPQAAFVAVTILIITCPCAMALAAPLVQVVAAGRLFREGAYLASGDALERLATVDYVVFDKTGTLTLGDPVLRPDQPLQQLTEAATLARASRHPFSRAIVRTAGVGPVASSIEEHPGQGVSGDINGKRAHLGRASFVGAREAAGSHLWFAMDGEDPVSFEFEDVLRPGAAVTVARLKGMGLGVELLSGDAETRVRDAAAHAGIPVWTAEATPASKAVRLDALEHTGRKVLMVGDGLNDAGALAKAHASLAPGGAVDVSRLASDCVFSGDSLDAVVRIIRIARTARTRMRENFFLAAAYNVLAIPIALAGWATPLVAAVAMSASSAVVTLNALRMSLPERRHT
jgi:Cu2+-exporting ATPase